MEAGMFLLKTVADLVISIHGTGITPNAPCDTRSRMASTFQYPVGVA
jgi:hypothetical protein